MIKLKVILPFILWIYLVNAAEQNQTSSKLYPAAGAAKVLTPGTPSVSTTVNKENSNRTSSNSKNNFDKTYSNVSLIRNENGNMSEQIKPYHQAREHVTNKPLKKDDPKGTPQHDPINNKNDGTNIKIEAPEIKPVKEILNETQTKDDGKSSVAKKGVDLLNPKNTSNINSSIALVSSTVTVVSANPLSSTIKVLQHKPLYTEPGDDSEINSKVSDKQTLTESDRVTDDKNKQRSEYIIPIVAVILSVPLVAITISFIYKRSKYWWQHRNYRRMDFLIEGMYHN